MSKKVDNERKNDNNGKKKKVAVAASIEPCPDEEEILAEGGYDTKYIIY